MREELRPMREAGEDPEELVQQFLIAFGAGDQKKSGESLEKIREWIGDSTARKEALLENIKLDRAEKPKSLSDIKDRKGLEMLEKILKRDNV